MYIQYWPGVCDSSGKFRRYRLIKSNFGFEAYLNQITIAKFRFAYARLRIQASYLHINRKLIQNNPNTSCSFCNKEENE